jgi:hypothetical protein
LSERTCIGPRMDGIRPWVVDRWPRTSRWHSCFGLLLSVVVLLLLTIGRLHACCDGCCSWSDSRWHPPSGVKLGGLLWGLGGGDESSDRRRLLVHQGEVLADGEEGGEGRARQSRAPSWVKRSLRPWITLRTRVRSKTTSPRVSR